MPFKMKYNKSSFLFKKDKDKNKKSGRVHKVNYDAKSPEWLEREAKRKKILANK